jgi:hypothetical protein
MIPHRLGICNFSLTVFQTVRLSSFRLIKRLQAVSKPRSAPSVVVSALIRSLLYVSVQKGGPCLQLPNCLSFRLTTGCLRRGEGCLKFSGPVRSTQNSALGSRLKRCSSDQIVERSDQKSGVRRSTQRLPWRERGRGSLQYAWPRFNAPMRTKWRPDPLLFPWQARQVIKLPCVVPAGLPRALRALQGPRALTALGAQGERYTDFVRERMLVLLREKLHPTAYREGPDPSEPCYTGRLHDNNQNLTLHLGPDGNRIFALCFSVNPEGGHTSDTCRSKAFFLGNLYEEEETFRAGAVVVDVLFLQRNKDASSPEKLAAVEAGRSAPTDELKLNADIDQ